MEEKQSASFMEKVAEFIVDKRKAFFLVFIVAILYSASSVSKVNINNDITTYLPENTETRIGLTIMEEEFVTYGSAQVMVTNITYEQALKLQEQMEAIEGISAAEFDDSKDHYKDSKALYSVSFTDMADSEVSLQAMEELKEIIKNYDTYISSEVGKDDAAELQADMSVILVLAVIVIVIVLLFTSQTYMEVLVFLTVFGVAALLNMGTNYWFGTISFITNAIAVVLQLALAIDYAIIMCHRYMEERETKAAREATIVALSKAIPEISSSCLTTISGLIALMLMQLKIGFDMGIVLTKGILCSILTVFLLMPGLLMLFNKAMDKTKHKNFVPKITAWGKLVVNTRFVVPVVFLGVIIAGCYFSNKCPYAFDVGSIPRTKETVSSIADKKIAENFGKNNTLAVILPKGDYEKEKSILKRVEQFPMVTSCLGLANVELDDEHMLTDKLTPRKFSEFADIDIELADLLYSAYALNQENYGALVGDIETYEAPVIDVFLFLCEQMEKGYIVLDDEQTEDINELYDTLKDAKAQLEGENYSRLVLNINGDTESEETYEVLDDIRKIALEYYPDQVILAGNSTNARDLSESFQNDNMKISVMTVLFVAVILLFTFKSAGIPVLLVLTIQGSIWINFSVPYLTNSKMYFLAYLIVSSIQMGATIDYAIVITNRYMELKQYMKKKTAIIESLNQSFPTVLTSGSIMTVAGFLIGKMSSDPTISSIGTALGRGTLTSVVLVMSVLPQILLLGDAIIEKTAISLKRDHMKQIRSDMIKMNGHVRGYVTGFIDADVKGFMRGDLNARIETKTGEVIIEHIDLTKNVIESKEQAETQEAEYETAVSEEIQEDRKAERMVENDEQK